MTTKPPETPPALDAPAAAVPVPSQPAVGGPLDLLAIALMVILCLSWGLNQVAIKWIVEEVPPMTQASVRAVGGSVLLMIWMRMRGVAFDFRDGTFWPGMLIGLLFGFQFVLIYQGLLYTSASRSIVYLFTAPVFVVIGARFFLPSERFTVSQWAGIVLSFAGIVIAFGEGSPLAKPEQALGNAMMLAAAICTAGTTLVAKGSALSRARYEKTLLYQLAVAIPVSIFCAVALGESIAKTPSAGAIGSLVFQTAWVAVFTYLAWYALLQQYSANRLSALTMLTPLFGVAAGHLLLKEELSTSFLIAVVMVTVGALMPRLPEIWTLLRVRLPRRREPPSNGR